ncbi:hypothetical protein C8J56DRAFT_1053860 [Mycena floridula]|nr:hypothetical protein C8J56DRAFT_1053860 [Mycena floridula]
MTNTVHTIHDKSLTPAAASAVAALQRRQRNPTWSAPPTTLAASSTTMTAVVATNKEAPASKLESSTATTTSLYDRFSGVTKVTQTYRNLGVEGPIRGSLGCNLDIAGKAAVQLELEDVKTTEINGSLGCDIQTGGVNPILHDIAVYNHHVRRACGPKILK